MRMGVREVANLVFKPLTSVDIGNQHFDAGQPVLYIDTAKTSNIEGAATTVYATGGRGNPRLIGWDGEKTLTLTVEDALISPESFAMLSGAGIVKGTSGSDTIAARKVYVHTVFDLVSETVGDGIYAIIPEEVRDGATVVVTKEAPVYATSLDSAGAPKHFLSAVREADIYTVDAARTTATAYAFTADSRGEITDIPEGSNLAFKISDVDHNTYDPDGFEPNDVKSGETIRIDCYTVHTDGAQELEISADEFAGYYYIEADTLFREEATGQDLPAQFVIPRGKIQSNFTFTMANSGDPSTFTFTIDCFPAYTKFNKTKKVLATLQILDPTDHKHNYTDTSVIGHRGRKGDNDVDDWFTHSVFQDQVGESDAGDDTPAGPATP